MKKKRKRRDTSVQQPNHDRDGYCEPGMDDVNIAIDPFAIYYVHTPGLFPGPCFFGGAFRRNKLPLLNDDEGDDDDQGFSTPITATLTSSRSRRYTSHHWVPDPLGQSF